VRSSRLPSGSFFSKTFKQKLVTTSSTHAEMRAAFQLIKNIVFINYLCQEIHRPISLPATILEDTQPVIDLSGEINGKSKQCEHFLMLINFIREKVEEGLVEFAKVASELNFSDILTKRVVGQDFRHKSQGLMGFQPGNLRDPPVVSKRKMRICDTMHIDEGPGLSDSGASIY
jgi:hypothetical protein